MLRVLHFFKTYRPDTMGGIEQVIFQLAEGCIDRGVESEVLYLSARGSARDERQSNHLCHRSRLDLNVASTGLSLSAIRDFAELARRADIIHYHFPWPFMDALHFASGVRLPSVVTYHSDIVKQKLLLKFYTPLMHRFLGSVDRIVVASPNYAATSQVLGAYRDKLEVIPFGLNRATYAAPEDWRVAYWRARLGPRFFLFVGAMRYYKGLPYLLEAARGVGANIAILGKGPLEATLREQARHLALDNVHFLGGLGDRDKTALLSSCHALVCPSHLRSEAFGICLLEGAMHGRPLISCEIGTGTSYVNVHGETGLVVPPADPAALREAMNTLLDQPERAAGMGRRALARYEALFSASAMTHAYARLYRSLM